MKTLLLMSALAGLVACSKGESKPKQTPPGAGSAVMPVAADSVKIVVDGKPVAQLSHDQVNLWPRLDTVVPMNARRLGTWNTISLAGAKSLDIPQPSASYPELVPAVFPGEGGKPAFGMFDPVELAKHGQPALRQDAITQVEIKLAKDSGRGQNDQGGGGMTDPAQLELHIKTAAGDQVVKGTKLLETPRQGIPGSDGEGKGWPLSLILENAGVKKYDKLLLTGENGTNLTLEKQDLDPKTSVPFVKLNRQGTLRFRVYKKQGDTWQAGADLRGLAAVEILK
jgi:hypothetical protein